MNRAGIFYFGKEKKKTPHLFEKENFDLQQKHFTGKNKKQKENNIHQQHTIHEK